MINTGFLLHFILQQKTLLDSMLPCSLFNINYYYLFLLVNHFAMRPCRNKYRDIAGLNRADRIRKGLHSASSPKRFKARDLLHSVDGAATNSRSSNSKVRTSKNKRRKKRETSVPIPALSENAVALSHSGDEDQVPPCPSAEAEPSSCTARSKPKVAKKVSCLERLNERLSGGRFRFINQKLYTCSDKQAAALFSDEQLFSVYHNGYKEQVRRWPFNPLDVIIADLEKRPSDLVVADMGCGEAVLAHRVMQTVHSFDLVALNERVTVANIANVPLKNNSVDVCVFCLSLMATNSVDYLIEGRRILKPGGVLKIVEIKSRFICIKKFCRDVEKLGFRLLRPTSEPNDANDFFAMFNFQKIGQPATKPTIKLSLKPCLYKKR